MRPQVPKWTSSIVHSRCTHSPRRVRTPITIGVKPYARLRTRIASNMPSYFIGNDLLKPPYPTSRTDLHLRIPRFIYGTAWKKDWTEGLVYTALGAGFRAIDTAAQPRHYREDLVGQAVKRGIASGLKRSDVYIQTKFTPPSGQDPKNIPYDPSQPLLGQIEASIASSLANFTIPSYHSPYLDCVLLHSPLPNKEQTLAAWEILESYVPNRIHALGISNCNLMQLQCLYESSTIKPSVVQNRFYPPTHFDVDVRAYCKEKGIVYQSFWTLTGNPALLQSSVVQAVAGQLYSLGVKEDTKQIALYALVLGLDDNICILNGTKDKDRMAGDLEGIRVLAKWIDNDDDDGEAPGGHGKEQLQWKAWMAEFWALIEHGEKMEGVGGQ